MAQLRDTTIEGLLNVLGEITSTTPLSIENGGTNASNKADARQNINYIGLNPISSINDDTTAVWKTFRTGVARINTTGLLTDQPTQYGFILSMVAGDDVRQLWLSAAGGDMYHRGGNASGWSHSWRKVLDVKNTADYVVEINTSDIWTYRKWNSGIAECWGEHQFNIVINTAWGNEYTGNVPRIAYPITFTERPKELATLHNYAYGAYLAVPGNISTDYTKTGAYTLVRPITAGTDAQTYILHYYVIGKWR